MPAGPTVLISDDGLEANPATGPTIGAGAALQTVNYSPTFTIAGFKIPWLWLLLGGAALWFFFARKSGGLKL